MADKKLIDLYPYRFKKDSPEYLLFKRAKGQKYVGQWRMVGGKVEKGEKYWEAALRELFEETRLKPSKIWTIPSVNQFYEHRSDQVLSIPAFAAQIDDSDSIKLNSEHSTAQWFEIDEAVHAILWPEQRRLLKLLNNILTSHQILDDWIVPHS